MGEDFSEGGIIQRGEGFFGVAYGIDISVGMILSRGTFRLAILEEPFYEGVGMGRQRSQTTNLKRFEKLFRLD